MTVQSVSGTSMAATVQASWVPMIAIALGEIDAKRA
jgi:hypothetical protein